MTATMSDLHENAECYYPYDFLPFITIKTSS